METKICKKCGKEYSIEEFDKEPCSNGKVYYRNVCKYCRATYRKQRRKEFPEIHKQQEIRRITRVREWQNSLKTACIVCGETDPVCLDWHHIDPNTKDFTIGRSFSLARKTILSEIEKCICLCANCHRKVHAQHLDLNDYISKNHSPEQRGEA